MENFDLHKGVIRAGIILGLSLAIGILTYSFWSDFSRIIIYNNDGEVVKEFKTFYVGTSLSFVGYTWTIKLLFSYIFKRVSTKLILAFLIIAECALVACLNGLADEMFFDPTRISWNEYLTYFGLTIYTIIIYIKRNRKYLDE